MTYFISIEELKQTTFNANLDNEYIAPALEEAQSIYLREIIGDLLYNSITNKIDSETLSGKYLTLVNQYIKPYLTYKVQSVIVIPLNNKTRNAGIINQYDQGFNTSTMKDTAYLADYYNSRAEFYANRLTTYLQKNTADFPEYGYSDDNVTQPTETQNITTIYLGGGRKKGCGCNTSTPQATATTVEWDNITNRPDFAQVAYSNDYNDLDNKPEIPSVEGYATEEWVQEQGFSTFSGSYEDLTDKPSIPTVNDALLTIKQGGVTKGTFSANSNQNIEIDLEAGGSGSTDWNNITNKPDFATVATSGSYSDLTNKPDLAQVAESGDYRDLSNTPTIPTLVQANWTESDSSDPSFVRNKPSLGAVATSNDYRDLDYKPSLAQVAESGDYRDLSNTPNLGAVATSNDYRDLDYKPTIITPVQADWDETDSSQLSFIKDKPTFATVATSGDYRDLSNTPNFATVATSGDYHDLEHTPSLGAVATSNDYRDLDNKPSMTAETWTFIVDNGQGGTTTVTKTVWLQ